MRRQVCSAICLAIGKVDDDLRKSLKTTMGLKMWIQTQMSAWWVHHDDEKKFIQTKKNTPKIVDLRFETDGA